MVQPLFILSSSYNQLLCIWGNRLIALCLDLNEKLTSLSCLCIWYEARPRKQLLWFQKDGNYEETANLAQTMHKKPNLFCFYISVCIFIKETRCTKLQRWWKVLCGVFLFCFFSFGQDMGNCPYASSLC